MDHQSRGDCGRIYRPAGRTTAGLSFRLGKQRRRKMSAAMLVGHRQDADDFPQHPPVTPEAAAAASAPPNSRACRNRIDAAKHGVTDGELRPIAVLDLRYGDC